MCIKTKYYKMDQVPKEQKEYFESLIGHTPFSFFQNFTSRSNVFDYYKNYAMELIEHICKTINQEFVISYEYLINPKINAGCILDNNINKIMIFEGVVFSLYNYAHKLVAHYKTVNMKYKREDAKGVKFFINDIGDNLKLSTEIELSSNIEDNILAEYIAMLAVKFIINHEIGHILNGHLLYRSSCGEQKVEFHMTDSGDSPLNKIDLQCMEIDADSFAVCELMSCIEKELIYDQCLLEIVESIDDIYKIAGCSIQCVFYLIGKLQDKWIVDTPECYSHPPVLTRVNLLLDVCREALGNDDKWAKVLLGCVIVERNLNDYFEFGNKNIDQFILDIVGTNTYGEKLLETCRKLKVELQRFTNMPFV